MNPWGAAVGVAVGVVVLAALVVAIAVIARRRRRIATELFLPFEGPWSLGARLTVRFAAPTPPTDTWHLAATLVCREHGPEGQIEVARVIACPHRLLPSTGEVLAEIDVAVPLDATPSMDVADHEVDWILEITLVSGDDQRSVTRHDVVVAPVVTVEVLEGELAREGDAW